MSTIKVLGSGCANCQRLTALTEQALAELGTHEQVEKVTDYAEIAAYGVMAPRRSSSTSRCCMAGRIPGLDSLGKHWPSALLCRQRPELAIRDQLVSSLAVGVRLRVRFRPAPSA